MDKQALFARIDETQEKFIALSDRIWEKPELSLREYGSMETYLAFLQAEGFAVETGLAGVPTAFSGRYGSGRPVIGILGEFDALSGLSQAAGVPRREELIPGGCGHGCGHNLLGAGALAAACAVRDYLAEAGEGSGTVVFFGCPGEEGGSGKAFMARDGLFETLDAALTWHPDDVNEVVTGGCLASYQVEYKFTGVAAHAAGCPWMGRSALDAAELMNVGVQFLREHIPPHAGAHYALTDAGGLSPNVVQPTAQVLYMLRSANVPDIRALAARVENIARGAALMTDTTLTRKFIDGTADTVPNETLERLAYENFSAVPLPAYTGEELAFAAAMKATCPAGDKLPGFAPEYDRDIADFVEKASRGGQKPLNDFLVPFFHSQMVRPGSTDVGDVSHQTPAVQIRAVTFPSGTPGHSWQIVAMGKSSIAYKGMLLAAKVLAATALDLYRDPGLLEAAQAEFRRANRGGYVCPIEPGAVPVVAGESM